MKNRIPPVWIEGTASRQAHCDLPEGTYEREIGRAGFFGPASHMHHTHPPTGWTAFGGPLRPRAFDLTQMDTPQGNPWDAPMVLSNAAAQIRMWVTRGSMNCLACNADGDQVLFVHQGSGHLYCDYGHLAFAEGDYLLMPRSTQWRLDCDGTAALLMIEATGDAFGLPDKGPVGQHAIYDPAILDHPEIDELFQAQYSERETAVVVKRQNTLTTITYPFNPLDAVGWHGELHPVRLNVRHIRPLMSHRSHLPPSAHTTFLSDRFVICTFAPRPFETDPGALKVPFFHNNDDYDEVLFYHAGDFFSRDNIDAGMMTFHPAGFTHGPHPKALANMLEQKKPATDEYAVMIDTRDPLDVGEGASRVENLDYVNSWKPKAAE